MNKSSTEPECDPSPFAPRTNLSDQIAHIGTYYDSKSAISSACPGYICLSWSHRGSACLTCALSAEIRRRAAEGSSAGLGESAGMATSAPETQHHISSFLTTDEIKARCADASIDFIQPGPGCYPHAWTLA